MSYIPKPYSTQNIKLDDEILELIEELAKNTHENWADERIKEGWSYGKKRNDRLKKHPCLIPYEALAEEEKIFDRKTSIETLKTIKLLGYEIVKKRSKINEI